MSSPAPRSALLGTPASGDDLRTASVRVRRRGTTVSSRPPNLETIFPEQQTSNQIQRSPELSAQDSVVQQSTPPPQQQPAPPTLPPLATPGRRRALTISQRLQTTEADDVPVPSPDQSPVQGRRRSATVGSNTSRTRVRQRSPSPAPGSPALTTVEDHDQDEVDLLEVLDQRVSTAVALTNISSAFWPSRLTSPPVVELDEPVEEARELEQREGGEGAGGERHKTVEELEMELLLAEEENDPLAAHLAVVLKKQRRKEKSRAALLGIWSFLKTPLGVAAAICKYALCFQQSRVTRLTLFSARRWTERGVSRLSVCALPRWRTRADRSLTLLQRVGCRTSPPSDDPDELVRQEVVG